LEDNRRRLHTRLEVLLSRATSNWPERLTLATQWRRLDAGGVNDIADWASSVPNSRLVVIDTLARVRPDRQGNDGLYADDYRTLAPLQRLASELNIAVVILHHTRKQEAVDPLDAVSGTTGLAGCADTVLVLSQTPRGATIYVRGRDIEQAEHAVKFDRNRCVWTIQGEAAEIRQSDTRKSIIALLAAGTKPMSPQAIAAGTGVHQDNVRQTLRRMTSDGKIFLVSRGLYGLSPPAVIPVTASQAPERQ
jgi:hypothetical protein